MAKKTTTTAAASAQITILAPCERTPAGFGMLPFVDCDRLNGRITRPQVSALKSALLASGYESLEMTLSEHLLDSADDEATAALERAWREDGCADLWEPTPAPECGGGWQLVALLELDDDTPDTPADAIAVLARKPGDADRSQGEALDDDGAGFEETPTPAPTMSKGEAHLGRKGAQFQLLEPTDALLKTFTPRVEKHGEDDVSAASLGLQIEAPNTILDLLSPSLRPTLYAAPEGQVTLPGVEESMPLLRTKVIETLRLSNCYEGWTLRISRGVDDVIEIGGAKVDKFVVTPRDGGTVQLDLRIGSSDIDETEAGWLYGHLRQEIEITLHAPETKQAAIDGSVEAFRADHPEAEGDGEPIADLFDEVDADDLRGETRPADEAAEEGAEA